MSAKPHATYCPTHESQHECTRRGCDGISETLFGLCTTCKARNNNCATPSCNQATSTGTTTCLACRCHREGRHTDPWAQKATCILCIGVVSEQGPDVFRHLLLRHEFGI